MHACFFSSGSSLRFVTLTFLFTCLTPVYQNFCEKSASFRIFLQRFVGMPDKRKAGATHPPHPWSEDWIQSTETLQATVRLCISAHT